MRGVAVAVGVLLLGVATAWGPVAEPLLVRFPTDLDQTARYEGRFTLYVDQTTGLPLPEPLRLPLRIERRIVTLPDQSGADTVVLREQVAFEVAGTAQGEVHQYVMDRRSMQNLDDPRSWSYGPSHRVDRSGTYRVNLPLGTDGDGRYLIWENEPGAGFAMVGDPERPEVERHGLALIGLQEVFTDTPVTERYYPEMRGQGFPLRLGFGDLTDRLVAQGVDVQAALAGLPADTLAEARAARLPFRFHRYNDGHALVEPRTGAVVDLLVSDEGISATVDLTPLAGLRAALERRRADPDASSLATALDDLESAEPERFYLLHYGQTDESVAEIAALTADELAKLDWVERHVPRLVAGAGLVLLAAGITLGVRRRRRRAPPRHERDRLVPRPAAADRPAWRGRIPAPPVASR
jgi:hypothetical protein